MFLFCFLIGIVVGFVLVFSSDNYLKLLTSENKTLYTFINGTAETGGIFWKKLFAFLVPLLLIFVLCVHYITALFSYVFITYQSALLILSSASVVATYGVSGVFNVLLIMLPINVLYFVCMAYVVAVCLSRSKMASKTKNFKDGYNGEFFVKLLIALCFVVALTVVACIIFPLFLKSSVFIIF